MHLAPSPKPANARLSSICGTWTDEGFADDALTCFECVKIAGQIDELDALMTKALENQIGQPLQAAIDLWLKT